MKSNSNRTWFFVALIYLIIDYGRPQDVLPIGFLKPGMIAVLILAFYLIFKGPIKAARCKETTLIGLFVLLLTLYIPFATNNNSAYVTARDMFVLMPFILSIIICVNSIDRLRQLIFTCVCLMIYVCIYGYMHKAVGSGSFFQDENDLSLYIDMWLPFCYFLFLNEPDKLKKYLYLFGLVVGVLVVILSNSRGGFVGLLCVSFVCWLRSSKKIVSLLVIFSLIIVVLFFASDTYWERIGTSKDTDQGTAAIRIESWKAGWRMFLDNPLGVGGNNYQVRFSDYQSDFFSKGMWGRVAHSLWFTLIPETGIIGIIIYFMLLKRNVDNVLFMRKVSLHADNANLRYLRALSDAFAASMAGFFAAGTFVSVLYYPHYWYLTSFIVVATKIAKELTGNSTSVQIKPIKQVQ